MESKPSQLQDVHAGYIRNYVVPQVLVARRLVEQSFFPLRSDIQTIAIQLTTERIKEGMLGRSKAPPSNFSAGVETAEAWSGFVGLMFVHLYHQFEQHLGSLAASISYKPFQKPPDNPAQEIFERTRIDISFLEAWQNIDQLRLVSNVVKHWNPRDAQRLCLLRADLFDRMVKERRDEHLELSSQPVGLANFSQAFLRLNENEYCRMADSVLRFWSELASVLDGQVPRPPTLKDWVLGKRTEILSVCQKHGASNVRLFGSVARDEAGPASDIDLLVTIPPGQGGWTPSTEVLKEDLQETFDRTFDVVSDRTSNKKLLERILPDAIKL